MPALTAKPAVHDHRSDLPPLSSTRTVTEEEALAVPDAILGLFERGSFPRRSEATRQVMRERLAGIDERLKLSFGEQSPLPPT